MRDDDQINLRDLDNDFNEAIDKKIEYEAKSRASFIGAIVLSSLYVIISTFIYGIFGYRGGTPEVGVEGFLIDVIVIGFIVYSSSKDDKNNLVWLSTILGTGMFLTADILLKDIFLYPFITTLFSLR